MTDPTFYAAATASALLAIAAALLFALRARDAESALRDAERSRDAQIRENGRLRALCQSSDAALVDTREELRQAKLAIVAAEAEIELSCRGAATEENGENGKGGGA